MAEIISAVYKITNTATGDFYIGSSKDVRQRWTAHKCPSTWKKCQNNPMYLDMQKYGVDYFDFEILEEVEEPALKETEQRFIEILKPTYNNRNANGWNTKRYKEYNKEYKRTERYKESQKEYQKEYHKEYQKTDKGKKSNKKSCNKYNNQLCSYNGKTLTLRALSLRFRRKGISNPTSEAKKYLINAISTGFENLEEKQKKRVHALIFEIVKDL